MYIYFAITGVKDIINLLYQGLCYCLRFVTLRFQGTVNTVKAVNSNQYTVIISF